MSNVIIFRPKKKVFWAESKVHRGREYQGILFPDGHVELGIDCWRQLNKNDDVSYDVYKFSSMVSMKREWNVIPIRKGYLMQPKNDNIIELRKEDEDGFDGLSAQYG